MPKPQISEEDMLLMELSGGQPRPVTFSPLDFQRLQQSTYDRDRYATLPQGANIPREGGANLRGGDTVKLPIGMPRQADDQIKDAAITSVPLMAGLATTGAGFVPAMGASVAAEMGTAGLVGDNMLGTGAETLGWELGTEGVMKGLSRLAGNYGVVLGSITPFFLRKVDQYIENVFKKNLPREMAPEYVDEAVATERLRLLKEAQEQQAPSEIWVSKDGNARVVKQQPPRTRKPRGKANMDTANQWDKELEAEGYKTGVPMNRVSQKEKARLKREAKDSQSVSSKPSMKKKPPKPKTMYLADEPDQVPSISGKPFQDKIKIDQLVAKLNKKAGAIPSNFVNYSSSMKRSQELKLTPEEESQLGIRLKYKYEQWGDRPDELQRELGDEWDIFNEEIAEKRRLALQPKPEPEEVRETPEDGYRIKYGRRGR